MKTLIAIALAVILCVPAFAENDMVTGSDSNTETIVGVYPSQTPTGSQDWVREYDGREFFGGYGIEKVRSYGYSGLYQYSFLARDLIVTDEDIGFNGTYGNSIGVGLYTSAMLHRLAPYYGANPWLVGTPGAGLDTITPLGPLDPQFFVNRRVNDFSIRSTPTDSRNVRFVLGNWQQMKTGTQQVLVRNTIPPATSSSRKSAAIPNDSETSETRMGFDAALGNASALNYRNVETKYGQYAGRGTPGSVNDVAPLNQLTRVNSTTPSQVLKVRTKITDWMHFTGAQIFRRRNDTAAHISPANMDIDSTNAALTMFLGDETTLTATYRRYNLGNGTPNVVNAAGVVTNHTLSKDQRSYILDATYTGLPRTYLKMGYERQNNNFTPNGSAPPWDGLTTKWDIFRAGFRICPVEKLNFQTNYQSWNDTTATFNGTPNKRSLLDINGTYMVNDNFGLYGNYNQSEEANNQTRVDPIPVSNRTLREEAAGQWFSGKFATTVVGAWYAYTPKLTFDLNWSSITMDSSALWVLGFSGANQQQRIVPFTAVNDQWSLGATYTFTPMWRLRGSYLSSNSDGKSFIDSIGAGTSTAGFGPNWAPISVNQQAWTLGVSRDVSLKDTLNLDYTTQFFTDNVDSANSGTFALWRISWTRRILGQ